MVDLPEIPRRLVTVDQIQDRVTPQAVAAPYAMFSRALDQTADIAETEAARKGAEMGAAAAPGAPAPFGSVGAFDRAYQKAAAAGTAAALSNDITVKSAEIQSQFPLDPAGQKDAWTKYADATLSKYPQDSHVRQMARLQLDQTGAEMQARAIAQSTKVDLGNKKDNVNALIERNYNDAISLARQGKTSDPAFKTAVDNMAGGYDQLKNPLFGVSEDRRKLDFDQKKAEIEAQGVAGHAERMAQEGNFEGLEKFATDIETIPNLEPAARARYAAAIRRVQSEGKSAMVAARKEVGNDAAPILEGLRKGEIQPEDDRINDLIGRANAVGNVEVAKKLNDYRQAKATSAAILALPTDKQRAALDALGQRATPVITPQASGAAPAGPLIDIPAQYPLFSRTQATAKVPGMATPGNIDLTTRPIVRNADGTVSTVRTISYRNKDGKEVLIPTVVPGEDGKGKILSNQDAIRYWGEKGQNFGSFNSVKDADAYAKILHEQLYDPSHKPIGGDLSKPYAPARQIRNWDELYGTKPNAGSAAPAAAAPVVGTNREQHAMQTLQGGGLSNVAAAGILGTLAAESRNLDPNAINPHDGKDGSDSIGIGQWNSTRAQKLKAFAAARGTSWNNLDTQLAFITHEMQTDYPDVWARLQAARTPEEAAGIVTTGYTKPAGSQSGPGAALYWERRREAAIRLAGGKFQPGDIGAQQPDPYGQSQRTVNIVIDSVRKANQDLVNQTLPGFLEVTKKGLMPDQDSINAMIDTASIAGDKGAMEKIKNALSDALVQRDLDGMTRQQLQGHLAAIQEASGAGGVDAASARAYTMLQDEVKQRDQMREKDPIGLAVADHQAKAPSPIDWTNAQGTLEGQLRGRSLTADIAAAHAELPAISIFQPNEKEAFSTFLQQAPADQVLGSLGAMAKTLPADTMAATMRDVAGDKAARPYVVAASMAEAGQVETAKAIVAGQRVLALNPDLVGQKFQKDAEPVTPTVLPPNLYAPALTDPASGQARAYTDAIDTAKAIYAAGKGPQGAKDFDDALWRQSLEKAVGGFVNKQATYDTLTQKITGRGAFDTGTATGASDRTVMGDGQKIIAPVPGMTQQDFSLRLGIMARNEVRYMVDGNGALVRPDQFLDQSKFEAIGSGQYLARLGTGYVLDQRSGRPFVLNFNARPPLNVGTVW
jgi:hypothetical protein